MESRNRDSERKDRRQEEFHAKSCQGNVARHAGVADKIKVKMRVVAEAHAPKVSPAGLHSHDSKPEQAGPSLVASHPRLFSLPSQPASLRFVVSSCPNCVRDPNLPTSVLICYSSDATLPRLSERVRLLGLQQWRQLAKTRHDCSPTNQWHDLSLMSERAWAERENLPRFCLRCSDSPGVLHHFGSSRTEFRR